jgi:hypothetical protein
MRITTLPPSTGFSDRPDADQLRRLKTIVWATHPWLEPVSESEFARGFLSVGFMFRLAEPSNKLYFSSHVDFANNFLASNSMQEIGGAAFLGACLAHGDIQWRRHDPATGQQLEVGLDRYSGLKCRPVWRSILSGEANLLSSLPPRGLPPDLGYPIPRPRVFEERNGVMVQIENTTDMRRA